MKTIKVDELPKCNFCTSGSRLLPVKVEAIFDAPTTRDSPGRGQWAHMCGYHFALYGIDTSVTVKMVRRHG